MDKYLRILQDQQHDREEEEDESPPENETPEERKKRKNRKAARICRDKKENEMIALAMTTQDQIENLFHTARLLEAKGEPLNCEVMQIGHNLKAMIEYHFEQFSKHREEVKKIRNISKAKIEDHFEQFPKHREMVFSFSPPQPSKGNRGQLHYPQQYPQPIPQYNGINNSALLLSSSNHNIRTYQSAGNFAGQLPYPQQSPPQHMFAPPNTLAFSGLNVNDNSVSSSELSSYEDGMSYGSLAAPPPACTTQYSFNNQVRAQKPHTLSPRPTWDQRPSEIPNDGKPRMSYGSLAAPPPAGTTQYAFNNQVRAEKPQTLSPRPTWGQSSSEIPNDGKLDLHNFYKDNFPEDFQHQQSKNSQL